MIDQVIERYIKLRDAKAAIEAKAKAEVAKVKEAMDKCEGFLLGHLNQAGVESVGSTAGTAFKVEKTSATVKDWDATLAFMVGQEAWHMLDHRVNKTAVKEYMDQNDGAVPPGVDWRAETSVQIRRT